MASPHLVRMRKVELLRFCLCLGVKTIRAIAVMTDRSSPMLNEQRLRPERPRVSADIR